MDRKEFLCHYVLAKGTKGIYKANDHYTIIEDLVIEHETKHKGFIGFGKHKGRPLDKIPDDYIKWLFENAKDRLDENQLNQIADKLGYAPDKIDF